MRQGDRDVMRQALRERNQDLLSALVAAMAFVGIPEGEIEDEVQLALSEQDTDTQHWWGGPCNCHGSLN